jgi:hypothetical protein
VLFPASAITLRSEATAAPGPSFVRVTLVPPTNAPASSFWHTPNTPNGGRMNARADVESKGMRSDGTKRQISLEAQTTYWPTPRASPSENRTTGNAPSHGNGHGKTLAGEACDRTKTLLWPTATATATDAKASGSALYAKTGTHNPGTTLTDAAVRLRTWPTPRASDGTKGGPNQRGSAGDMMLTSAARSWPTPSARDWRSGLASEETLARNSRPLNEVACQASLQAPTTEPPGPASSPSVQISPQPSRLNTAFVEWMMGWPDGWTLPYVRTGSEPAETASSPGKPPMLGADSGTISSEDEAA